MLQARGESQARADARLALALGLCEIDDGIARFDAAACGERNTRLTIRLGPLNTGVSRPKRPLGVVRVSDWRPEQRVNRVTDVALDDPTFPMDQRVEFEEGPVARVLESLRAE